MFKEFVNIYMLFDSCVKAQDDLNSFINPNWKEERTASDFELAIIEETVEYMNSLDWKWWKKQEPDYFNARLELVDIFHFLLSREILITDLRFSVEEVVNLFVIAFDSFEIATTTEVRLSRFINSFLGSIISSKRDFYWIEFWYEIFRVFGKNEENLFEFFNLFFVKLALNRFRQMEGYKEGSYRKIKDGKEDNEILKELLNHLDIRDYNYGRDWKLFIDDAILLLKDYYAENN